MEELQIRSCLTHRLNLLSAYASAQDRAGSLAGHGQFLTASRDAGKVGEGATPLKILASAALIEW